MKYRGRAVINLEHTQGTPTDGAILLDCKKLLASYSEQYVDDPAEHHRQLCLLALEREQLVSYAYQDDIMRRRLEEIDLPPDLFEVLRHALLQLWRDEEAHTIYLRGLLAGTGTFQRNVETIFQQAAGLLSGWSAALKHHVPRSKAPVRSVVVDGLALGGRMVGRLSPDLRAELGYKSFHDYCVYNIDAEQTAELCWRRMVELDDDLGYGNRATFERIAQEEDEHRQVFQLIAEMLDPTDTLRPEWTAQKAADRLSLVAERVVHPTYRDQAIARGSLGKGGTVHVLGEEHGSKLEALTQLLAAELIDVSGRSVAIKTSWMMGYSLDDPSSVTDPSLLRTLAEHLTQAGATKVVFIESPNIYSNLYANREVATVATYFGIDQIGYEIDDTSRNKVHLSREAPLGPTHISAAWVVADVRLSVTHLRTHPTEHAHLTSANLEGLIDGTCMSVFWGRSYEYYVGPVAVGLVAAPDLAIIDAWDTCPDGWFGVMAGRQPKDPKRLYGGKDALAVDLVALNHTGSTNLDASPTIRSLSEWFGDPRPATTIIGIDRPIEHWRSPHRSAIASLFAEFACAVYAWLSRSGAVFTPAMDDTFVEKKPLPLVFRPVRYIARIVLGLRPPSAGGTK